MIIQVTVLDADHKVRLFRYIDNLRMSPEPSLDEVVTTLAAALDAGAPATDGGIVKIEE